jgi:adenylate kinase
MAAASSIRRSLGGVRAFSTGAKPLRWCFLGAPGVGKGTFASRIAPQFKIPTISSGDLIRAEIKSGSALGQQIKATNDAGQLVSDDIVTQMIRTRLAQPDTANGKCLLRRLCPHPTSKLLCCVVVAI